jgi:hypothetical protein
MLGQSFGRRGSSPAAACRRGGALSRLSVIVSTCARTSPQPTGCSGTQQLDRDVPEAGGVTFVESVWPDARLGLEVGADLGLG